METQKRTDAQIYELCFKDTDYEFWDNKLYTPLQVGSSRTNTDVCNIKDNTGQNISNLNNFYSETTGTYWIWKNAPKTKYIGQCQYRRRIQFPEDEDFNLIFSKYGIIVNNPIRIGISLKYHMELCHPQIDTKLLTEIINQKCPQYMYSWIQNFVKGNILFYSTSYVLRWEDFEEYCEFLFDTLKYYTEYYNLEDPISLRRHVSEKLSQATVRPKNMDIDYQSLIGGFIQERLASVWILHKFNERQILTRKFTLFENLNY